MEEERKKAVEESTAKTENVENVENSEKEEDYKLPDISLQLEQTLEFEGKSYDKIDLNGLYNLSLRDISEVQQQMVRNNVYSGFENSVLYYAFIAANVNHMPYEWLDKLDARDATRLQVMVRAFLFARV